MKKVNGFTIIELLTVLSIIIILLGLLAPGLNAIRLLAKDVEQRKQFYAIGVALDFFNAEWDYYPRSDTYYSGATLLAKAMVGDDLRGYSIIQDYNDFDINNRRQYLPMIKAKKLGAIYTTLLLPDANQPVLCDVYAEDMPVLYFRANKSVELFDIYDYADNETLIDLGKPWSGGDPHLLDATGFYESIQNESIGLPWTPYRIDSYILMSAGFDNEYGTSDDIINFRQ